MRNLFPGPAAGISEGREGCMKSSFREKIKRVFEDPRGHLTVFMIAQAVALFLFPLLSWFPTLICWVLYEGYLFWRNRREKIRWLYGVLCLAFLGLLITTLIHK